MKEVKRIPVTVAIPKNQKKRIKLYALNEDITLSKLAEKAIIERMKRENLIKR